MTDEERAQDPLAREPRTSGVNLIDLIEYFTERQGVAIARLLDGVRVGADFLKNPETWADNYDTFRLHRNCHRAMPGVTHRDWQDFGRESYISNPQGHLRMVLNVLSTDVIQRGIPFIVPHTSRFCEYGLLHASEDRVLLSFQVPDRRVLTHYTFGTECWYDLGVFSSLPKLHDAASPLAAASHAACCMPIGLLLENCYDLHPPVYRYDEQGVSIHGTLAGRWIRLQSLESHPDSFTHEHSVVPRKEANAVLVIRDVDIGGRRAFHSGEIYDAPHCIFDLKFADSSFVPRILSIAGLRSIVDGSLQSATNGSAAAAGHDMRFSGLTPREGQIARLVSLGMHNADIADELYISQETVKRHLYNIYAKLGVTNRVQLARTLVEQSNGLP